MGDRYLLSRMAPEKGQLERALKHIGPASAQMRKELAEAVARLFAGERREPRPLSKQEFERLDKAVTLVVRLRGAVERDRHSREMEAVYGAEGTGRIGLALERLLAGLDTLGVERETAVKVMEAVALDSVPPLRRRAFDYLRAERHGLPGWEQFKAIGTPIIAQAMGLPTVTVRRALEDLAAYRLIDRQKGAGAKADQWTARQWENDS
jgi:hypothetical protein